MSSLVEIATLSKLKQENLAGAEVAGVELVAVAHDGGVSVFEGRCPHQGTLFSEGSVANGRLVCRAHGWQFDCAGGARVDDARPQLQMFSTVVEGDTVLVDAEEVAAWAAHRQIAEAERERPLCRPEHLPGPPRLPFVGNLHQIHLTKFHQILEEWYRQYGDVYQIKVGRKRIVVVADLALIHEILMARPGQFARSGDMRQTIQEMGVEGLFSTEGDRWRRHRHVATRAFDVRHLRGFLPAITRVTQRLYHQWLQLARQQSPIDTRKDVMRYAADITVNLAFGYDMNTLEEEQDHLFQHLHRVFAMIARRILMPVRYWDYVQLPADRALERSLAELRVSTDQFVDHARRQIAENPDLLERPQNLLQALLAAQMGEDSEFSDFEISGNVSTFLVAGTETTANTIAWIITLMAQYPEVQRKMQAEADAVLGDAAVAIDFESVSDLHYIEAVAHEAIRLKPVVPIVTLQAATDVTIHQTYFPEGTPVYLLIRPKAMENREFAQAAEFKPERWLEYPSQDNPHQRPSYRPFGGGPRICPGRSLALLEIKVALSMICRHFDVALAEPGRPIEERFLLTMAPQDLTILLHPRHG